MSAGGRAEKAGFVGLALVWLATAVPFLVDSSRLAGVSRCALAALPWLAWSGAPRALRTEFERLNALELTRVDRVVAPVALELALFAPAIALGAWIDLASAARVRDVAIVFAFALVASVSLAIAARLASGARRGVTLYATAWFVLVPLAPLFAGALTLGGAPLFGALPSWLREGTGLSPIGWMIARLRFAPIGAFDDAESALRWPGAASMAVIVLVVCAIFLERNRAAEAGER